MCEHAQISTFKIIFNFFWIGLKSKNTTDGLEGRPLIYTENRGTRKIPQVIKQNIVT